jgi:TonB family protein
MFRRLKAVRIIFLLAIFILPTSAACGQDFENTIAAERHYKLGRKFYRAGQTEKAIDELYTALSVREIYYEAQLLLGRSLIEAKRYREAAATLREIDAPLESATEVHKLLAKAHYETNKLFEASRNLYYAISYAKRPDYELHYLLALVKLRQGDADFAIDEATRTLELKPRFAPARKLLSDAYLMNEDYRHAEQELKHYLPSIRDRAKAAEIKEQIGAIGTLGAAKPEKSIQQTIILPVIHRIPRPAYTLDAIRYKVEGAVWVTVLFGSDGAVKHALVTRGLGFGLDEKALKAAWEIEFKPGEVDGKPMSMWIRVKIQFPKSEFKKRGGEASQPTQITGWHLPSMARIDGVR